MASTHHLQLSSFIKQVHEDLRKDAKNKGCELAWKRHCENKNILQKYASCMLELATEHWETNYEKDVSKSNSRNQWMFNFCQLYFFGDEISRQRKREHEIAFKMNVKIDQNNMHERDPKLKLLDVGSCYNPMKTYTCFDILAIDIAPNLTENVKYCDFLNVDICEESSYTVNDNEVLRLPQNFFNVIIFSLFLEYLPSPAQRLLSCKKAYRLLKQEGLLIIITPDSKCVGANAKFMKSWRHILARLGFSRIKYEKLPHIHCMAFRKSLNQQITNRWSKIQNIEELFDEIFIPQDFTNDVIVKNVECISDEEKIYLLNELPFA